METETRKLSGVMDDIEKHEASIELSNKCREFYHRRLESAEDMKRKMSTTAVNGRPKSTLDKAMDTLRKEMSSLMDQDLSLMKQLLMLNESIEELKWRRRCSEESLDDSSCDLDVSDWSVSDNDIFASDSDLSDTKNISDDNGIEDLAQSLKQTHFTTMEKCSTPKLSRKSLVTNVIYKQTSQDNQSSCDSGIHDINFTEPEV